MGGLLDLLLVNGNFLVQFKLKKIYSSIFIMSDVILYSVIIPIVATLLGVVVGAVITYFSSIKILERQQNIQKVNIAKAFLSEIKSLEKWLKPTLDDNFLVETRKEIKFNLYRHAMDDLHWDRSFYDDTDLFFNSRSLIYYFDEDLFEKLEEFYSNLLVADEYRQVFLSDRSLGAEEVTYHERRRYNETIDMIKHTYSSINDIKTKLQRIISVYGKKNKNE